MRDRHCTAGRTGRPVSVDLNDRGLVDTFVGWDSSSAFCQCFLQYFDSCSSSGVWTELSRALRGLCALIVDLFMRLVVQSAVDALMKKKYGDSVTLGRRHAAQAAAAPTLAEDPEQLHFEQQQGRRGHGDTNKGADADQHRQSGRPVANVRRTQSG